mgnify:CR=1 FL=1
MSLKLTKAALEARLVALANALPTKWENVPFSPPADGAAWQRCDFMPAVPDNPTLGDGFYREHGIMQVTLSYPLGGGSGPAYTRAEALRVQFKKGSSFASGAVTVHVDRAPAIGPGREVEDRFVMPVSVTYRADIFA